MYRLEFQMMESVMNDKRCHMNIPDFDQLMALAQDDPESFETVRRECIDSFIQGVSEHKRQRLIGLQWRIDQSRQLASNPMAACIAISNMMWDSLHDLNAHQRELMSLSLGEHRRPDTQSPEDDQGPTVIPFRTIQ